MNRGGKAPGRRSRAPRAVLGALALSVVAAPLVPAGCAATFDPPTQVSTLRVLAISVEDDKSYVVPPEAVPDPEDPDFDPNAPVVVADTEVTFKMELFDGYRGEDAESRPAIEVTWLGGCFNPPADQYFACYDQLGEVLQAVATGVIPPDGLVAQGPGVTTFKLKIPPTIVSERPPPDVGPHYGIGYVFFAVCAGKVRVVPPDGTGRAPDFPLGCFDDAGNRLGPDSFVPGYTQVYAFADGRTNKNPQINEMTFDDAPMADGDDFDKIPVAKLCPVTEEERRTPRFDCDREDTSSCTSYTLKALIDSSVVELDKDATGETGGELTETLWISYFADAGDISPGIKLVNDSVAGFNPDVEVSWVPPSTPGIVTVWAVLRDARGGSSVQRRFIRVE